LVKGEYCDDVDSENTKGMSKAMDAMSSDSTVDGEMEQGWELRGSRSSFRRNAKVWIFAVKCVFKVLAARKLTEPAEIKVSQIDAATFMRDGLVRLGPSFVKLGQVNTEILKS
jgi:hypothetical protein